MTDSIKKFWEFNTPASNETGVFIEKCMNILDRIHELMEEENINQKQLAERLGKTEAEVSKWLNGVQNFTLKTICKLEAALEHEIISVPDCKFESIDYSGANFQVTKFQAYQGKVVLKRHVVKEVKFSEAKNQNEVIAA
jgi:transcriptional regulator with XRE-family HTH domain